MTRYRNLLLFLALSVLWGAAFVAIKAGLDFFPPVLFAAIRYDIAGVLMLAYAAVVSEQPRPRGRRQWAAVAVGSVLLIGAYHAFLFVGEQHTTSAAAAVVVSLSPVLTAGFAQGILPGSSVSRVGLLGMGLGLLGVLVLASPDPANLLQPNVVGIGLVFAAALSFAVGSVLTEFLESGLPVETMQAWSMLGGAVLMHALAQGILGESLAAITWTPAAAAALAYLSIGASALGFLVYFDLLERIGSVEINLVSYVAPIVAAIVGAVLLGERADVSTALGFLSILAGFALIKRKALRAEVRRWRAA